MARTAQPSQLSMPALHFSFTDKRAALARTCRRHMECWCSETAVIPKVVRAAAGPHRDGRTGRRRPGGGWTLQPLRAIPRQPVRSGRQRTLRQLPRVGRQRERRLRGLGDCGGGGEEEENAERVYMRTSAASTASSASSSVRVSGNAQAAGRVIAVGGGKTRYVCVTT